MTLFKFKLLTITVVYCLYTTFSLITINAPIGISSNNRVSLVIGFMLILGVNMVFRLNKSLMSLCPFTKILAPLISPFFVGLEKFRRVDLCSDT